MNSALMYWCKLVLISLAESYSGFTCIRRNKFGPCSNDAVQGFKLLRICRKSFVAMVKNSHWHLISATNLNVKFLPIFFSSLIQHFRHLDSVARFASPKNDFYSILSLSVEFWPRVQILL